MINGRSLSPLLFAYMSLTMTVGWWLGQDMNWDLRSYHFYTPHMLLTGRIDQDVLVSGLQTFFNPLFDLPWYVAHRAGISPVLVGMSFSAFHGIALWSVHEITLLLLQGHSKLSSHAAGLVAAAVGLSGSAFYAEIGTTMGDNTAAVLVVGSVLAILSGVTNGQGDGLRSLYVGGLLLGFAIGGKPVTAFYGPGAVMACLAMPNNIRIRLTLIVRFGLAVTVGILLTNGLWMALMFRHFNSPLFPYFSGDWQPSLGAAVYAGVRPLNWQEALTRSFSYLHENPPVSFNYETLFRDPRFAVLTVCLVLLIASAVWWWASTRVGVFAEAKDGRLLCLATFMLVSYICWLELFGYYRFAVGLELLCPPLLIGTITYVVRSRPVALFVTLLASFLIIANTRPARADGQPSLFLGPATIYGRIPWSDDYFGVNSRELLRYANATMVLLDMPNGYLVPYFPSSTTFVRVLGDDGGGEPKEGSLMWLRMQRRLMDSHSGRLYMLESFPERFAIEKQRRLRQLGLSFDQSSCVFLNSYLSASRICRMNGPMKDGEPAASHSTVTSPTVSVPRETNPQAAQPTAKELLLIAAAVKGDNAGITQLLADGVDVNTKDREGGTALAHAAWFGHLETVKLLLGKGADVNAKKNDGATPLSLASSNRHRDVIEILAKAGAK